MLLRWLTRIAVLALAAVFLLSRLGEHHWLLDLFSHFRPHYAVLLLLGAVALILLRDTLAASAALAVAIAAGWPVLHDVATARASTQFGDQPELRVLTVNAWFRNDDIARVAEAIESSGADVVIVQELSRVTIEPLIERLKSYPYRALDAAEDRHGAAIVSRWPIETSKAISLDGSRVLSQLATIRWQAQSVDVLGVHLTWPMTGGLAAARNAQWNALIQWMTEHEGAWIVAGDLNLTPWSPFFDRAAHVEHCFENQRYIGTWPAWMAPAGIQIDHCFTSSEWQIVSTQLLPPTGSDHRPVLMRAQLRRAGS